MCVCWCKERHHHIPGCAIKMWSCSWWSEIFPLWLESRWQFHSCLQFTCRSIITNPWMDLATFTLQQKQPSIPDITDIIANKDTNKKSWSMWTFGSARNPSFLSLNVWNFFCSLYFPSMHSILDSTFLFWQFCIFCKWINYKPSWNI